jgi:tetratricopeptide (TPR) repeat protein
MLNELTRCLDENLKINKTHRDCVQSKSAQLVADIADSIQFSETMGSLRSLSQSEIQTLKRQCAETSYFEHFRLYSGLKLGEHRIAISPTLKNGYRWNGLVRQNENSYTVLTLVSQSSTTTTGRYDWNTMLHDIAHEHSHGLLDSVTNAAIADYRAPGYNINHCYETWDQCLREHVAQGISLRLSQLNSNSPTNQFSSHTLTNTRLPWQSDVADLLRIKYEKSRNHYKTIAQFVPLIVELVYKKAKRNYSRRMTEPSQTAPPQTDRISEGIGYYQRGLWRMAQLSFESSIRNRDGAQAWLNLAITLRSLGQMNESATAHSIAIEVRSSI